jgi:hypothetical protein
MNSCTVEHSGQVTEYNAELLALCHSRRICNPHSQVIFLLAIGASLRCLVLSGTRELP